MKKRILSILLMLCMVVSLAACGKEESTNSGNSNNANSGNASTSDEKKDDNKKDDSANTGAEVEQSGFVNGKFTDTRKITVEIYDRGNDGGTDYSSNRDDEEKEDDSDEENDVEDEDDTENDDEDNEK